MKTNPLPEKNQITPGKPVTNQQEPLTVYGSDGVCEECLHEDFDSCVCPEPES